MFDILTKVSTVLSNKRSLSFEGSIDTHHADLAWSKEVNYVQLEFTHLRKNPGREKKAGVVIIIKRPFKTRKTDNVLVLVEFFGILTGSDRAGRAEDIDFMSLFFKVFFQ